MHASSSSSSGSFSFAGTEERLYGLVSEQSHTRYPRNYEIYGMSIESTYVHSAANQIAGWKYIEFTDELLAVRMHAKNMFMNFRLMHKLIRTTLEASGACFM